MPGPAPEFKVPGPMSLRNEARRFRVSEKKLKKIVRQILKQLGLKKTGLSILLTDDRRIQTLNRRFLHHDRPTDVIAFGNVPRSERRAPSFRSKIFKEKKGSRYSVLGTRCPDFLGDLVISLETTERQAAAYGNRFDYELAFYLCHGILHLIGYSDKTKHGAAFMERKQKQILKHIRVRNK